MGLKKWVCMLLLITVVIVPTLAMAQESYTGYNYNAWNEAVPTPNGYVPDRAFTGRDLGIGDFKEPQDMYVDSKKDLYILDSGNNRIVVLDREYNVKRILDKFSSENGEEKFNNPKGIFVDADGIIYIADGGNNRVVIMDQDGNFIKVLKKPQSDIYPKELKFQPEKLVVTSAGVMYVLAYGMYRGAIVFDEGYRFEGFFGSNRVETTATLLTELFWKRILTREQREKMIRFIPVEYSNIDIDDEDFIYTCTRVTTNAVNQIKKLNPSGINVLRGPDQNKNIKFGDQVTIQYRGKKQDTAFVDVKVDENGFMNGVDATRGRIFQYTKEGDLLFIFGGIGDQLGTFSNPVAVESLDEKILILDSSKGRVTSFVLTQYGELLHHAIKLYNDGLYKESLEPWHEILKRNSNSKLAYRGIAKALNLIGDYKGSLYYFKLSNDRGGYSNAFKEYRKIYMRENFSIIMLFIILLFVIPRIVKRYGIKRRIRGMIQSRGKGGRGNEYQYERYGKA